MHLQVLVKYISTQSYNVHLDTITATYTTYQIFKSKKTAIKKMSSKKKKAWKSDSEHSALLFLLYHFRVYDPNGYSAVEIYDHPDFPFKDNYSKKISTHIVKRFPTGVTTTSKEKTPSAESSESSWTP